MSALCRDHEPPQLKPTISTNTDRWRDHHTLTEVGWAHTPTYRKPTNPSVHRLAHLWTAQSGPYLTTTEQGPEPGLRTSRIPPQPGSVSRTLFSEPQGGTGRSRGFPGRAQAGAPFLLGLAWLAVQLPQSAPTTKGALQAPGLGQRARSGSVRLPEASAGER